MPDQGAMRQLNGFCIDGHTLGEGFSGKVKRGVHLVSGETVALKCIKESHLRNPGARRLVDQEIHTMEALGEHPHIVSLLHADRNAVYPRKGNKGTRPVVLLALSLCEGGELLHVLTETGALGETVARTYFHQLLSALGHCHANGVSHNDLKPENLLLSRDAQLKLADFGHAATLLHLNDGGSPGYLAPEAFRCCRLNTPYDGSKADIWAAGVILFIMICGNPPFSLARAPLESRLAGQPCDWFIANIANGRFEKFWQAHLRTCSVSESAQDLLNRIFTMDPMQRASLEDILQHPWMQGETLSPEALGLHMAPRLAAVAQAKEQERLEKLQAQGITDPAVAAPAVAVATGVAAASAPTSPVASLSLSGIVEPEPASFNTTATAAMHFVDADTGPDEVPGLGDQDEELYDEIQVGHESQVASMEEDGAVLAVKGSDDLPPFFSLLRDWHALNNMLDLLGPEQAMQLRATSQDIVARVDCAPQMANFLAHIAKQKGPKPLGTTPFSGTNSGINIITPLDDASILLGTMNSMGSIHTPLTTITPPASPLRLPGAGGNSTLADFIFDPTPWNFPTGNDERDASAPLPVLTRSKFISPRKLREGKKLTGKAATIQTKRRVDMRKIASRHARSEARKRRALLAKFRS